MAARRSHAAGGLGKGGREQVSSGHRKSGSGIWVDSEKRWVPHSALAGKEASKLAYRQKTGPSLYLRGRRISLIKKDDVKRDRLRGPLSQKREIAYTQGSKKEMTELAETPNIEHCDRKKS